MTVRELLESHSLDTEALLNTEIGGPADPFAVSAYVRADGAARTLELVVSAYTEEDSP